MGIRLRNIFFLIIAYPLALILQSRRVPPILIMLLTGMSAIFSGRFFIVEEFKYAFFFLLITGLLNQTRVEMEILEDNRKSLLVPFDFLIIIGIATVFFNYRNMFDYVSFGGLIFSLFSIVGGTCVIITSKAGERWSRSKLNLWLEESSERIIIILLAAGIFYVVSNQYGFPENETKRSIVTLLFGLFILNVFLWSILLYRTPKIIIGFFGILGGILNFIISFFRGFFKVAIDIIKLFFRKLRGIPLNTGGIPDGLEKIKQKLPPHKTETRQEEFEKKPMQSRQQEKLIGGPQFTETEIENVIEKKFKQPVDIAPKVEPEIATPSTTLKIKVLDDLSKMPIKGVKVGLVGGRNDVTNEEGEVSFSGLGAGRRPLKIEKELYEPEDELCVVKAGEEKVLEISLNPSIGLSPVQQEKISKARKVLNDGFGEVSTSFDNCVPGYLKNVGMNLIEFVTKISETPGYFSGSPERYSETMDGLIEVLEPTCNYISEGITKKKNIDIFSAIYREFESGTEGKAGEIKRDEFVKESISNPDGFVSSKLSLTENKLSSVDNELTKQSKQLSISPLLDLWTLSKNLLENASSYRPVKKACTILIVDILLDYIKEAFVDEEIIKRLKVSVI